MEKAHEQMHYISLASTLAERRYKRSMRPVADSPEAGSPLKKHMTPFPHLIRIDGHRPPLQAPWTGNRTIFRKLLGFSRNQPGTPSGGTASPTSSLSRTMLTDNFRKAAKGHGTYCPVKNELQVRKGRKIHHFRCGEHTLLHTPPARQEITLLVASDATAPELRHCFDIVINSTADSFTDIG
jgi:hypothetical protein